jgi:LysM repeat protein
MTNTTQRTSRHGATKERVNKERRTAKEFAAKAVSAEPSAPNRFVKGMFNTIPIVLVGTMAMTMNVTGPLEPAHAKRADRPKVTPSELGRTIRDAFSGATKSSVAPPAASAATMTTAAVTPPSTYHVVAGDTVSSIAGRYGLATASVLALNGLGWKSVIFAGQTLKLSSAAATPVPATPRATNGRYTIVKGDTIGAIAARFGVKTQAILSANGLGSSSIIYPGQTLAIPTASTAALSVAPVAYVAPIAATPHVTPVPKAVTSSYVIANGDTLSKIATRFGVSIQSILDANGLNWSSLIYTGRSLTIPGATVLTTAPSSTTGLTAEMAKNASTIIAVGRSLKVSDYGIVVALSAAMQESSLRNLDYGDRDSLGLFQQRPSAGWGSRAQLTNPTYATKLFFGGPSNPNRGNTRGLLDISGWQSKTVTQAAQAVQKSAYPDAYAQWEASAWVWLDLLG